MYENKVKWCPVCNQGWIEIVKDVKSGELFCCCSECENEWNDPKNISEESCNKNYTYGQICDPDESEDKIMSVKKELDSFFERFLEAYQKTEDGLPKRPRRKDVDQAVYVGEAGEAGWCRWRSIAYGKEETFIKLLETYGIESNNDIIEYFSAYHFLGFSINYKKSRIAIRGVDPRDEYKSLKQVMEAYTDSNGKVAHFMIGTEAKVNCSVVVEVKTGIVKFADDNKGKMRKIAPSLEEFIRGWEPRV